MRDGRAGCVMDGQACGYTWCRCVNICHCWVCKCDMERESEAQKGTRRGQREGERLEGSLGKVFSMVKEPNHDIKPKIKVLSVLLQGEKECAKQ